MLLCFLTATCHLSIILIAGRACILSWRYSRRANFDRLTIAQYQEHFESFNQCLQMSEWVQGLGQALFAPAILYSVWQLFEDHFYAYFLYGFIALLDIAVYATGFWRVSWAGMTIRAAYAHFVRRNSDKGTGQEVA
ncbi:hypothetical protein P691DRAFT_710440 [Macrolepiota fuliginosa MF-IS2]|uniref:Uncharacterized protein n=1 Tax=Macrolepiota fuliginosa MF-IS2 TaxID=1400762 RepID=A0A9P6BZG0_9AGAR|nr:hypothetical protein P691DRAFT_710440 [Macrolepiota fuliginosa MF-IS2]